MIRIRNRIYSFMKCSKKKDLVICDEVAWLEVYPLVKLRSRKRININKKYFIRVFGIYVAEESGSKSGGEKPEDPLHNVKVEEVFLDLLETLGDDIKKFVSYAVETELTRSGEELLEWCEEWRYRLQRDHLNIFFFLTLAREFLAQKKSLKMEKYLNPVYYKYLMERSGSKSYGKEPELDEEKLKLLEALNDNIKKAVLNISKRGVRLTPEHFLNDLQNIILSLIIARDSLRSEKSLKSGKPVYFVFGLKFCIKKMIFSLEEAEVPLTRKEFLKSLKKLDDDLEDIKFSLTNILRSLYKKESLRSGPWSDDVLWGSDYLSWGSDYLFWWSKLYADFFADLDKGSLRTLENYLKKMTLFFIEFEMPQSRERLFKSLKELEYHLKQISILLKIAIDKLNYELNEDQEND